MRKIRKEYKPVEVSEAYKKAFFSRFREGDPRRNTYYFRKNWPPFHDLFTDDEGRLYILTYEEGVNPRE